MEKACGGCGCGGVVCTGGEVEEMDSRRGQVRLEGEIAAR